MRALDTTKDAFEAQLAVYRKMAATERLEVGLELTRLSRISVEDGIRSRHPEYSEEEVRRALIRLWLGRELFLRAYPDLPEIEP